MKPDIVLILFIILSVNCFGQGINDKAKPYMKTGYGYFSDEFIIDGTCFSAEVGIIQPNKFSFGLNHHQSVALNDKGSFSQYGLAEYYMYNNYNATTLFTGYHMSSRNSKHVFVPRLGVFYSLERFVYPGFNEQQQGIMEKAKYEYIGFALNAGYQYNLTKNVSVGFSGSVYYAYQYGFIHCLLQPEICITID